MSTVTPIIFALNHYPVTYEAKLLKSDGVTRDLTGNSLLEVVFTTPDGIELRKTAAPKDPGNLLDTEITYTNNSSPSVLNQRGYWEFRVVATFGANGVIPSYQKVSFWVL